MFTSVDACIVGNPYVRMSAVEWSLGVSVIWLCWFSWQNFMVRHDIYL